MQARLGERGWERARADFDADEARRAFLNLLGDGARARARVTSV
ncbi:MAG TPA: hypothetical protein VD968_16970 [Pyrinomonadaceae bacterium]|nr:hypothetical protein [Pyrinomonadaceae bacterium]